MLLFLFYEIIYFIKLFSKLPKILNNFLLYLDKYKISLFFLFVLFVKIMIVLYIYTSLFSLIAKQQTLDTLKEFNNLDIF